MLQVKWGMFIALVIISFVSTKVGATGSEKITGIKNIDKVIGELKEECKQVAYKVVEKAKTLGSGVKVSKLEVDSATGAKVVASYSNEEYKIKCSKMIDKTAVEIEFYESAKGKNSPVSVD